MIAPATEEVLLKAARLLEEGELVAFPTETVYGLGANALNSQAVAKIYQAKGRPSDNPLIAHFPRVEDFEECVLMTPLGEKLARALMPGPLTLVLPAREGVPSVTRGGLDTLGCRVPSNEVAHRLLSCLTFPLAAPSANRSGRPSPTQASTVAADLGDAVSLIIDGGACKVGLESTVVDARGDLPILLRPGGISVETLRELCGEVRFASSLSEAQRSPGTRYRHYAPRVEVVAYRPGMILPRQFCFMGFGPAPEGAKKALLFDSLEEYGRSFYEALRVLEEEGLPIYAQEPPKEGFGLALADRLARACGKTE